MAITAQTKERLIRLLKSHIVSCDDYIKSSETYLHRSSGKVDEDYFARREEELTQTKNRLLELKSALKDIELNA